MNCCYRNGEALIAEQYSKLYCGVLDCRRSASTSSERASILTGEKDPSQIHSGWSEKVLTCDGRVQQEFRGMNSRQKAKPQL